MIEKNKKIPLEYQEPHYSTKMWKAWHQYISIIYSSETFAAICEQLNVTPSYLLRDGDWVSHSFTMKFVELAKKMTGDEKISQRVGEYTLHPDFINPFEYALLKFMPIEVFFYSLPMQSAKLNKLNMFSVSFNGSKARIKIMSRDANIAIDNEIVLNMIGLLQSAAKLMDIPDSDINTGRSRRAEVELEWNFDYRKVWLRRFFKFGFVGGLVFGLYTMLTGAHGLNRYLNNAYFNTISIVGLCLSGFFGWKFYQFFKMHAVFEHKTNIKNDELFQTNVKLERRYQESNHLRMLATNLVTLIDSSAIIDFCLSDLKKKFGYARSVVMLLDRDRKVLYSKSTLGFDENKSDIFTAKLAYPGRTGDPMLFANILQSGQTQIVSDVEEFKKKLTPQNQTVLDKLDVKSLIISPIQYESEKFGLLMVGSIGEERLLDNDDKFLIDQVTRMLSFYFRNAQLFEKETTLKNTFQKYVPAAVMEDLDVLSSSPRGLAPRNTEICSIFVDLRGFTSLSEVLLPEVIVQVLNFYYDWVTSIFAKHGGIVDNLVGDGIVVFFPKVSNDNEYVRKAVRAVFDIFEQIDTFHQYFSSRQISVPAIGIGMDSGNATVGSFGGSHRMNYTAIGDIVNTASRLEAFTKTIEGSKNGSMVSCVASLSVIEAAGELGESFDSIGDHAVRGKQHRRQLFYTNDRILRDRKYKAA